MLDVNPLAYIKNIAEEYIRKYYLQYDFSLISLH